MDKEFFDWLDAQMTSTMEKKTAADNPSRDAADMSLKWETLFTVKEKIKDAMYRKASQ